MINQKEKQIIWEEGGGGTRPLEQESKLRFRPRKTFTVQVPGSSNEIMSSKYRLEVGQDNGRAAVWRARGLEGRQGRTRRLNQCFTSAGEAAASRRRALVGEEVTSAWVLVGFQRVNDPGRKEDATREHSFFPTRAVEEQSPYWKLGSFPKRPLPPGLEDNQEPQLWVSGWLHSLPVEQIPTPQMTPQGLA